MISLLTWSVVAFGLAWVIADSKLTYPFRKAWADTQRSSPAVFLLALFECPACLGWHLGWAGYLFGIAPFTSWWQAAFFTCGSSLLLAKYVGMLDE